MRTNVLHNSDCIKGMLSLPEGSVDLAFADPPFNIGYDYDVYEDKMKAEEYLDWSRQWGAALLRALKPDGSFRLAIGDDFAAELKLLFQRDLGLTCRSWVIWYYTFGVNCTKKFARGNCAANCKASLAKVLYPRRFSVSQKIVESRLLRSLRSLLASTTLDNGKAVT